jgi:hypothetical protein
LSDDIFYNALAVLSDIKSVSIFKTIGHSSPIPAIFKNMDKEKNPLDTGGSLSSKQFYLRISALINAGLVKRDRNRVFSLTSFGKVVYSAIGLVELAASNYEKLKAIDSIQAILCMDKAADDDSFKVVNTLIDNRKIKHILLAGKEDHSEEELGKIGYQVQER